MLLYPAWSSRSLVGTDIAQAIPLVGAAALGHLLFGEVKMGLTLSLIIGSVPGAVLGARLSAVATPAWMRRFLAVVLLASALKLLHAPYSVLGAALAVLAAGWLAWLGASRLRRRWAPQPVPGEE